MPARADLIQMQERITKRLEALEERFAAIERDGAPMPCLHITASPPRDPAQRSEPEPNTVNEQNELLYRSDDELEILSYPTLEATMLNLLRDHWYASLRLITAALDDPVGHQPEGISK